MSIFWRRLPVLEICAIAAVALIAGCSKPSADDHLRKGNEYLEQSRLADAGMEYRMALQADPKRGDVRLKLADLLMRNRDAAGALKEYVRAADLLPENVEAQLKAGHLLLLANAFEDAKTRANAALKLDAKNVDAQVLLGNALAGLKDLDGAIAEYQEAIALNPAQDTAYVNIGAIQLARGQRAEAEAAFRKAVEAAPTSVPAHIALANFLWATERAPEAEQTFKAALAIDPVNLDISRALGVFYMASGRAPEAEPYFQAIAAGAKTTDAIIGLADYYIVSGRFDEAKRVLTELAARPDAFAVATVRLAAVEAGQNNRAVASAKVKEVLDKFPKDMSARLLNARLLLAADKRDEAFAVAESMVKDAPSSAAAAEAYGVMGGIYAARDRTEDAIKAYGEMMKLQAKPLAAALALAQLHLGAGAPDKAMTYAQQALAIQPRNPLARSLMVRINLAQGNVATAARDLATLQKEFPNAPPVLNLVATRYLAEGKVEAARAAFSKIAAETPDDLEALNGLVTLDLMADRKKEAADRVDAALKRTAPTTNLLVLAARAHGAAGNLARSEELLKQAIDADPARLVAYGMLGQLYVRQKRLADARDQFTRVTERDQKSISANTMLGMILEAQGDIPAAEQQYQKTLGIDPTAPVAANNLAWIYAAANRNLDQALQLAQTALQQLPDQPNVRDTIGWVYYRKGLIPQAIQHLEASVEKNAGDSATHYHLGMAYLGAGNLDKARRSLQKALSLRPDFEGADEARKALERLTK